MALSDVWRDIGQEISVYSGSRLNLVPGVSGVYAWFYPLRLTSDDLSSLVAEVHKVLFFDPESKGIPARSARLNLNWRSFHVGVQEHPKPWSGPSGSKAATWAAIRSNPDAFDAFRKMLLKASILLPPLYVGKTTDLYVRCWQHINGSDSNTFHSRYESFAQEQSLYSRSVKDLLFVCIRTEGDDDSVAADGGAVAVLLEDILKAVSCPPFGIR